MFRETTPRILVPFCFFDHELSAVAAAMSAACDSVCTDAWVRIGFGLPYVDCMLRVSQNTPMVCFWSDRLAGVLRVNFASFDCDSLTRLVLGMTMDDSSALSLTIILPPPHHRRSSCPQVPVSGGRRRFLWRGPSLDLLMRSCPIILQCTDVCNFVCHHH